MAEVKRYNLIANPFPQVEECTDGRYVRESDYLALLERHRRLVLAAEEVTDWMWNEILRYADVQDEKLPQDLRNLEDVLAEEE